MSFEQLREHLQDLVLPMDFITEEAAKELIATVNEAIKNKITGAYILDVLRKEEIQNHKIILSPFASTHHGSRGGARPKDVSTGGVWSETYKARKIVLIEGIQKREHVKSADADGRDLDHGYIRLTSSAINDADRMHTIQAHDLIIFGETDAILMIPLEYKGSILGLYSIELYHGSFKSIYKDVATIAEWVANVLWKLEIYERLTGETGEAVKQFKDFINEPYFKGRHPCRIGFIARPFKGFPVDFEEVEKSINKSLWEKGSACVEHYSQDVAAEYPIEDIMERVKLAHFGVADLTGISPNVMLELGMMKMLGRKVLLIKHEKDNSELPFDLRAYNGLWYNENSETGLYFIDPGSKKERRCDVVVQEFVEKLFLDQLFKRAQPYIKAE